MKKLFSILIALLVFASLPSCNKADDPEPSSEKVVFDDGGSVVSIETVVNFVFTYSGNWDDPTAMDNNEVMSVYYGLDSAETYTYADNPYVDNPDIQSFTLLDEPSSNISPCDFVKTNEFKNENLKRAITLTANEGQKIYISVATGRIVTGEDQRVNTVTHQGYITIDDDGLVDVVFQEGTIISSCDNTIGIKY